MDWSWVNPIMHCVAEPCGQTAVYIRALISLPGEQLQIWATERFGPAETADMLTVLGRGRTRTTRIRETS